MIRAILVDDEQAGIENLQLLIEKYYPSEIEIVGVATDMNEGVNQVNSKRCDLLFLDIEMPYGSGFALLDSVDKKDFEVIFVTAYDHHAIKAIKYAALDYLLKPVDIDEFKQAVANVQNKFGRKTTDQLQSEKYSLLLANLASNVSKRIALPSSDGLSIVKLDDIVRLEAAGSYTEVYTSEGEKIVVSKNLKEFEELFPKDNFSRVHKSHLINIDFVKRFVKSDGGYLEMKDGTEVQVSRTKRENIFKLLSGTLPE